MNHEKIKGYCPMGCGETLFVGEGGYITCSWVSCPAPDAVSTILEDGECEHVARFSEDAFVLQHPLRERLDGALFDCTVHQKIAGEPAMPVDSPGRYRVMVGESGLLYAKI
jgi:hypothetical protein